jgi:hypothetical protein
MRLLLLILVHFPGAAFACGAGHVPMLADPTFAEMVQAIGVASLGADEKQICHLTKVMTCKYFFCALKQPCWRSLRGGFCVVLWLGWP